MKRFTKWISLLLCLSMLLSFVGCTQVPATQSTQSTQTTQATQATQTTQSTAPTESLVLSPYQTAADLLSQKENLEMTVERQDVMVVNGQEFTSSSKQKLCYLGLGTDSFSASVTQTNFYGTYRSDMAELYADGTAYVTVYESNFSSKMTQEDYLSRYLPVLLLDESLYESCTQNGSTLSFEGAERLEHWLQPEAELLSASATATIGRFGSLDAVTYEATYRLLGAEITTQISVQYWNPTQTEIAAPTELDCYTELDFLDGPMLLERAYGYLLSADCVSSSSMEMTVMQATGLSATYQVGVNTSYATGSLAALVTRSQYTNDSAYGQVYEYAQEERFEHGKYTSSENGGEAQEDTSITTLVMNEYIDNILTDNLLDCGFFTTSTCTDLGSLLLLEFNCNKEFGQIINENICETYYEDPYMLDNMSTNFRTVKARYYVGIDKYLGLPTALGIYFEGKHIINGRPYLLVFQADQAVNLASLDSYKAIHEEVLVGAAPETPATPLFYKVTGSKGQEMWLMGTIHVGDDRNCYLPQAIYDAFDASDALAVECNADVFYAQVEEDPSLQQVISKAYYYSDGSTSKDHVDDQELYKYALQLMKATGNYNYNTDYLKVAVWSNSISNYYLQQSYSLQSDKGVDALLMERAYTSNKPIYEVESTLFQLQMLTGWSQELSILLLEDALASDALSYRESILHLYDLWCQGDEAALIEYLSDDTSEMTPEELSLYNEYNNAMSIERDKGMVQKAIEYLESGKTVFYAVGLAHLLSQDGLVNALRAAGYTVELVEYE